MGYQILPPPKVCSCEVKSDLIYDTPLLNETITPLYPSKLLLSSNQIKLLHGSHETTQFNTPVSKIR